MKQHKRFEIDFRQRLITVFIDGRFSHEVSFAKALNVQKTIIVKLLESLERNGFRRDNLTPKGAWVYEGMAMR